MPTYNPTDSRFLTLAQTRTNNGTRDVKLILDTIDKVFYTLDDDGVFDAVDNETAATIVTLSVGTLEGDGANPITLDSPLVKGGGSINIGDSNVLTSFSGENGATTFRVADYLTQTDATGNDLSALHQVSTNQIYMEYKETAAGDPLYTTSMTLQSGLLDMTMISDPESSGIQWQLNSAGILVGGLPSYADNADATNGGLTAGQLYITDGSGTLEAGVLMVTI